MQNQSSNALGFVAVATAALALIALSGASADHTNSLYAAPTTAVRAVPTTAAVRPSFAAPAQGFAPRQYYATQQSVEGDVDITQSSVTAGAVAPSGLSSFVAAACLLAASVLASVGLYRRGQADKSAALAPLSMQEVTPQQWAMASTTASGAKPLEGKVAVVTGATRGIGAEIAKQLGQAGATVIGTATSEGGAAAISAALAENGIAGEGMVLNVTDADQLSAAVKTINDKYGAPTVLINNAGITRDKLMMQMKDDDWDSVISTNLSAIFRVSKAFQRGMTKARWGRIISISSVVGSMGNMGQTNYAAAKAGVGGFTKSLAREMASRNVTVNAVAPGFIETDMTKDLPEEWADKLKAQIPAGRMGSTQEVAAAVLFLASPDAAYITGETIHVNGGMYMA